MNLVDCHVTQVFGEPKEHEVDWGKGKLYSVQVEYNSYGRKTVKLLYFDTFEEAQKVKVGYKFEC